MPPSALPLVSLQNATKAYGVRPLFEQISLVLGDGEKVALIGPNGSGKSTLLRAIIGEEALDSGTVSFRKGLRIGYVAQKDSLPADGTVGEILAASLSPEQHNIPSLVSQFIGKGGFADRNQPINTLSGGWRKRLTILRELIKDPQLLILDEPTNHLDIESILWLEGIILEAPFSVFFVSHDYVKLRIFCSPRFRSR